MCRNSIGGYLAGFQLIGGVKDSHSYFEGPPINRNPGLRDIFSKMINGQRVEDDLPYDTHSRTYQVP